METITLNNGIKMPILGYGVYMVDPSVAERCVLDALSFGYRSLDTSLIRPGQGECEGLPEKDETGLPGYHAHSLHRMQNKRSRKSNLYRKQTKPSLR